MEARIKRPEGEIKLPYPRIGFIKTGFKDARGLPKSTDYFICTGKYSGLFKSTYGETPDTIQIVFPDDNEQLVCIERYEYRDDDGRLYAKGDGINFDIWNGKVYQSFSIEEYPNIMETVQKRCPTKKSNKGDGWDIVLTLNFILPLVRGIAGYWSFSTKGNSSTIPQVRNLFDAIREQRGFVKGILFDLSVQFAKSNKPGVNSKYPVVSLIPNESEENMKKFNGIHGIKRLEYNEKSKS